MKRGGLLNMSPEAQRIAIAEACGWTRKSQLREHSSSVTDHYWWRPGRNEFIEFDYRVCTQRMFPSGNVIGESFPREIPDYLNDLNAMHGAEKTLADEQYASSSLASYEDISFIGWLFRIMVRRREKPDFRTHSATAAQRAEAFLRALNLWDDSK